MREVTLGELCSFRGGSAFPQDEQGSTSGDVPFVKVSDLALPSNSKSLVMANNWVSSEQIERLRPTLAPAASVLFAKIGAGLFSERFRIATRDTAFDNNMMSATARSGVCDPDFLYYLLHTVGVSAVAVGSALPYLKQGDLVNVPCRVPSIDEQRAIGEVLGALDDKITANTRQAITARELMVAKTASAQEHCELRHLATRTTSTVKPEELGDTIVDHFSLPAFDAAEGPERVQAGVIKSNKTAIDRPCVLLSKLNPRIPRAWDVVTVSERPSMASTEFLVLEPKGFSSSVLWAVISQPRFWSELSGMVAGTSGSHQRVRPGDVLAVNVIDPRTISEPVRRSISALGEHVAHVHVENVSLATTRDALLPLLMSGMVTVRDAELVVEGVV